MAARCWISKYSTCSRLMYKKDKYVCVCILWCCCEITKYILIIWRYTVPQQLNSFTLFYSAPCAPNDTAYYRLLSLLAIDVASHLSNEPMAVAYVLVCDVWHVHTNIVLQVETPRNCGNDKICNTQLSVEIVDVANTNDSSRETDTITVLLRVNNTGEDSFRTNLISTFNRNVFNLSAVILVSDSQVLPVQVVQWSALILLVFTTATVYYPNIHTVLRWPISMGVSLSVCPPACIECLCLLQQNDLSLDCSDAPNEDNSTDVPVQCLVGNPMRSNTTVGHCAYVLSLHCMYVLSPYKWSFN